MKNNNLRPAIIHIGGGFFQTRTIQWAKEAGFYVAVTDRNPSSPGAVIADRFANIAGDDIDAVMKLAEELSSDYLFKGIWCHADFCLMLKAKVQESFGIDDLSSESAALALDKDSAKKIWLQYGISTPQSRPVNSKDAALAAAADIGFPLVFKPIRASGSIGVSIVNYESEIPFAYDRAAGNDTSVFVEEFLSGREFGVNGIFYEAIFYPAGISERSTISGTGLLKEVIVPAPLSREKEENLYETLKNAALRLGIKNGCVKGDCILSGDVIYILELSPRLHGNPTMSHAMPMAAGISPVSLYFKMLAGVDGAINDMKSFSFGRFAGYRPVFNVDGIFNEIKGLDNVKKMSGIDSVEILLTKGKKMIKYGDNRDIVGYIFGKADSAEELRNIFDEASGRIKIDVSG